MVLRISKSFIKINELGNNKNEKLIVLHNMLGEGIDVKSFTGVVFPAIHLKLPNPWVKAL